MVKQIIEKKGATISTNYANNFQKNVTIDDLQTLVKTILLGFRKRNTIY